MRQNTVKRTVGKTGGFRRLGVLFGAVALGAVALSTVSVGSAASAGVAENASSAPACVRPEMPLSRGYDAATEHDRAFNASFRHCFLTVDGVQMHYVIGGHGQQTVVLLHGWPESWYEWHETMPGFLPGRTVIAVDLPGMGDSTGQPPSYRKTVLGDYVHLLLDQLGKTHDVRLVAHDLGGNVAYAMAARYRGQISGLFLLDSAITGKNFSFEKDVKPLSWHFSFNQQEPLAENLVTGRVRTFLTPFYPQQSKVPHPISEASLTEYVRVYSRAQVLHAGFGLYRTWDQDDVDNAKLEATPLTIPVYLLSEGGLLPLLLPPVRDAAPGATGSDVPGAGHWLPEERPAIVVQDVNRFFPVH